MLYILLSVASMKYGIRKYRMGSLVKFGELSEIKFANNNLEFFGVSGSLWKYFNSD